MQGLFYLLSLIAFGVITVWFIQNDELAPGERTTGLLRMKHETNTSKAAE